MPETTSHIIAFRPVPNYPFNACKHYREHRQELETMDDILIRSGLDEFMLQQALKRRREQSQDEKSYLRGLDAYIDHARSSFRISILRASNNLESVRKMEISLGSNTMEQWFCFIPNFDQIKSPSKSSIDRRSNPHAPLRTQPAPHRLWKRPPPQRQQILTQRNPQRLRARHQSHPPGQKWRRS